MGRPWRKAFPPSECHFLSAAERLLARVAHTARIWQDALTCVGEIDLRAQAGCGSLLRSPPPQPLQDFRNANSRVGH